jgi:acyl-coenzyme A thioesterase PaaI-like protein
MPCFEPRNPAYAERVQSSFNRQQAMALLGAKVTRLAPGECNLLIARGRVLKSGRTLVVTQVDAFVVKGGGETLCATLLQTLMTMHGRPDL